jgi:uncharacterized membrane protein
VVGVTILAPLLAPDHARAIRGLAITLYFVTIVSYLLSMTFATRAELEHYLRHTLHTAPPLLNSQLFAYSTSDTDDHDAIARQLKANYANISCLGTVAIMTGLLLGCMTLAF